MSQQRRATLTDWAWVEVMVMQAMVGSVILALMTVVLTEEPEEWVITFYFNSEISDDEQQDYIEIAGDAETYLDDRPREKVHTTDAIRRPLRSVLKFEKPPSMSSWNGQDRSRLLFCLKPSLIWTD